MNGYGGVRGVGDALGNVTWIDREDSSFPALPTRVRYPNGWEVTAVYNSVGLPDTIIDRSNGAVTTYQWNTTFEVPTQITSPEGVVTTFRYDGVTGNLEARLVGEFKDSLRYNSDGLVDAMVDPVGRTWTFEYDDRGNLEWEETPDSIRTLHFADYVGRDTLTVSPINDTGDSLRLRQGYDVVGRPVFTTTRNDLDSKWDSTTTTYDSITGDRIRVEAEGESGFQIDPSEWSYDGLGRVKVAKNAPHADTIWYDLAGNDTLRVNTNGDTIRMTYDLLGRLKTRYASGKFFNDTTTLEWGWRFPIYDTLGLTIDTMTAEFTYDTMGNLLTANNAYARITRTYHLNGGLESEQQALRRYDDPDAFSTHVYDLAHFYDLDGRRVHLGHPAWLSPGTDRTDYAYDPTSGRLSAVTDALGLVYAFEYNADGQPKVRWFPSGVDSLFYDDQGRPYLQTTRADGVTGVPTWHVTRDVAGRVRSESGNATYEYDGLGHLVESEIETEPQLYVPQYFTRDPFGNVVIEQDFEDPYEFGELDPPGTKWDHGGGGRRLESEEEWDYKGLAAPNGWNPGRVVYRYDDAGNVTDVYDSRYTHTYGGQFTGYEDADINTHYRSYSKSYYGADGLLRVHQINRDSVDHYPQGIDYGEPWGAYEEYWYDALGRRVLKRSRQEDPICTYYDEGNPPHDRCYSSIERFVWDGDQILWELRHRAETGDSLDVQNPTGTALSGQTGHVGYVHAGGIDAPLGMIRNGTGIVLHRNWKGLTTFTTDADGDPTTCAPSSYIGPGCSPIVSFPGASWALTQGYEGALDVQIWYGSVTMGHQDRTGLRYQRNRYHDPSAGQFTQMDPIGIAGGLNLYGFAGGDPINFSDPFGLFASQLVWAGDTITVQSHTLFGSQYRHTLIRITPDDQDAYANHPRFDNVDEQGRRYATIGAGPELAGLLGGARLISGINRDNDVLPHGPGTVVFAGQGEKAMIKRLFMLEAGYPRGGLPYQMRPTRGYNSNSFISGLLRGSGLPVPPLSPRLFPGWDRPVPFGR